MSNPPPHNVPGHVLGIHPQLGPVYLPVVSSPMPPSDSREAKRKRSDDQPHHTAIPKPAAYEIRQEHFGSPSDLPPSMRAMAMRMKDISLCHAVLPARCRSWERDLFVIGASSNRDTDCFTSDVDECATSQEVMAQIVKHAQRNYRLGCSESSWDTKVRGCLLDEAVRGSRHCESVNWEEMGTAVIKPLSLIPEVPEQQRFPSAKANFAIMLELGEEMELSLTQRGLQVNHTDYIGVNFNPLAVSIETKRLGQRMTNLRMNKWASAHARKLRELLVLAGHSTSDLPALPPLPLIIIEGHDWKFACFQECVTYGRMWTGLTFGSTSTLLGGYQIIAGIQCLIDWANTTYRIWLEKNILKPLTKTSDERKPTDST